MVTMEENIEMLLRRNRMSAGEMSMTERLMRQKNTILQRQLEVSLRILDKEGRTSQKHIQRLVNEYSEFLSDLPCRWVGLDTYTQPDTRALRKKSREKKESRVSVDGSVCGSVAGKSRSPNRPKSSRVSSAVAPPSARLHPASAAVPQTSPRLRPSLSPTSPRTRPRSSPTRRELPKFNTCIEVLDDIIQNHSLRKKTHKHRRIGLIVPPSVGENLKGSRGTVNSEATGRTVYIRPSSGNITSVSTPSAVNCAKQRIRPHTAQPSRATGNASHVSSPLSQEEARRPKSAVSKIKRPKSAPPNYELYGRSPAVPKRTVAGIMAEMNSRRAATRDMLGKSKQLQKYISHLAWPDV